MAAEQASNLRTLNEYRHKQLCLLAGALPPTRSESEYHPANGVFPLRFAKQDALLDLVSVSPRIRGAWESTMRRFDWDHHDEYEYYSELLAFFRDNNIHRPSTQQQTGDTGRSATLPGHQQPKEAHRRGHDEPLASPPSSPLSRSIWNLDHAASESAQVHSKKRKATEISTADSTDATGRKPATQGDPLAMRNGYDNFKEQYKCIKLANNGVIPRNWDQRAALYECYVQAHIEKGIFPPWRLIEASLGEDKTQSVKEAAPVDTNLGSGRAALLRGMVTRLIAEAKDTTTSGA